MAHLAPLISDLALILMCAGVMTLLFKKLKQPLVLGYIVAGFLAGPHFGLIPSVSDAANIQVWSDIGVIFLLFALGLEFSFKKLMKAGGSAVMAACIIILCMIAVGVFVGNLFGWKQMDCLFLGGMLAMSSTTIIYKAFDDLGLQKQRFTGLVLSILILEDILAIVLMVVLSTLTVSKNFEGGELVNSIMKLVFFLILWFVVGIFLVPLLLKRIRKLMSDETLLIVALAFCFGMVVLAAKVGFSPAFGAFIMGSILAETVESEHIGNLVSPVKDLFGAIFFVSVGMMVDFAMIAEYIVPIVVIVVAILLGQVIFGTGGVLLSGQSLKTSMQCGFSLTQIGEFAFIIASLGVSLHVTSEFLYPIVVAVSVITTFLTPYMIRLSVPAYNWVDRILPVRWHNRLEHYVAAVQTVSPENNWKKLITSVIRVMLIYLVLSIAGILVCFQFILPVLDTLFGGFWGRFAGVIVTLAVISPFLRALIMKKNHSLEFRTLWADSRFNHAPLVALVLFRVVVAIVFVMYIIGHLFQTSAALLVGIAILLVVSMVFSRFLKKRSIELERTFVQNLRSKDMQEEYLGGKKPAYAGQLLDRDLHLADYKISSDSAWGGKTLRELDFGKRFGVHVVSIIRGHHRVNIPGGDACVFPEDTVQVIGTDVQLNDFSEQMKIVDKACIDDNFEKHEMVLKQIILREGSSFVGKTIKECGIRNHFHCLVVGIGAMDDTVLRSPDVNKPLQEKDILWVVGEEKDLSVLTGQ